MAEIWRCRKTRTDRGPSAAVLGGQGPSARTTTYGSGQRWLLHVSEKGFQDHRDTLHRQMRDLDETDRSILRLLLEDARRPYSDIGERVDLSGPAVSDRVDRLREMGVLRRFTIDIDAKKLRDGTPVLVELVVAPGAVAGVRDALAGADGIDHVFETADGDLLVSLTVADADVRAHLSDLVDLDRVRELNVRLLAGHEWHPGLGEADLALDCVECGNTVTSEGVTAVIGGERRAFCCSSCQARFRERYEDLADGA